MKGILGESLRAHRYRFGLNDVGICSDEHCSCAESAAIARRGAASGDCEWRIWSIWLRPWCIWIWRLWRVRRLRSALLPAVSSLWGRIQRRMAAVSADVLSAAVLWIGILKCRQLLCRQTGKSCRWSRTKRTTSGAATIAWRTSTFAGSTTNCATSRSIARCWINSQRPLRRDNLCAISAAGPVTWDGICSNVASASAVWICHPRWSAVHEV
jgi:hypothetical protein